MNPNELTFTVEGDPIPEGSTSYMGRSIRTGKPMIVHANPKLQKWRTAVRYAADFAARQAGWQQADEPVTISVVFRVRRPKRPRWPVPAVKPDLDKLIRAVGDAITPTLIREDSRIVGWTATKKYIDPGERLGATITIRKGHEQA